MVKLIGMTTILVMIWAAYLLEIIDYTQAQVMGDITIGR